MNPLKHNNFLSLFDVNLVVIIDINVYSRLVTRIFFLFPFLFFHGLARKIIPFYFICYALKHIFIWNVTGLKRMNIVLKILLNCNGKAVFCCSTWLYSLILMCVLSIFPFLNALLLLAFLLLAKFGVCFSFSQRHSTSDIRGF